MVSLEQFFNDNDKGYPRDPRRMAYAKLRRNVQGMDREQLEAFIKANLMIPHSQYKMALGNLIKFLQKQDQMNQLNEVRQFQKIAGILKESDIQGAEQIADKVEDSVESKLDQLSPDQIQQLQADLAKMGITADTPVEDAAHKIEGSLDEAEGDDKKKLANALQSIGTGLIGSLLVPIIPLAVGQSTGLGTAAGLGITFAAGGLLVGLAKALKHKSSGQVKEDDYNIPADAQSGDTAEMGNINENAAAHVVHEFNKIIDVLKAKGKINDKTAKKILDYAATNGENLYHDYGTEQQMFNAAAEAVLKQSK